MAKNPKKAGTGGLSRAARERYSDKQRRESPIPKDPSSPSLGRTQKSSSRRSSPTPSSIKPYNTKPGGTKMPKDPASPSGLSNRATKPKTGALTRWDKIRNEATRAKIKIQDRPLSTTERKRRKTGYSIPRGTSLGIPK